MTDYLKRLIFDFLFYRRTSDAETKWFFDKKHNSFLVPEFELKIDDIVNSFERYRRVSYDTQGLRDKGIDVLLKYNVSPDEDNSSKYIGFQIKSATDLSEKNWLTKLKAQVFDAKNHVYMEDFYIVLCTDSIKHRDKIRDINAEISKEAFTHIVRPEYACSFFQLGKERIAAYLKAKISDEDQVFREAFESLVELTPQQAAIVIELVVSYHLENNQAQSIEELFNQVFVRSIYDNLPNLPIGYYMDEIENKDLNNSDIGVSKSTGKILADDLEALSLEFLELDSYTDSVRLVPEHIKAVSAITMDGHVRYGYSGDVLKNYLLDALLDEKIWKAVEYKKKTGAALDSGYNGTAAVNSQQSVSADKGGRTVC